MLIYDPEDSRIWRRKEIPAQEFRRLRLSNKLTRVHKGIYEYLDSAQVDDDIVIAQQFFRRSIVSMFSAAHFHDLTTVIPSAVQLTLPSSGTRRPLKPKYPHIDFFFADDKIFRLGAESIALDGYPVRIYDRERTVCDMFRYLSRVGMDSALEVFKNYMEDKKNRDIDKLIYYSRQLRVYKYIGNYVEVYIG